MTMDCRTARTLIEQQADGLLRLDAGAKLEAHISICKACAVEQSRMIAVGRLLRSHAAARTVSAQNSLDMMWTRVRAGIGEKAPAGGVLSRRLWAALPVGALALLIFALLFYPSGPDRSPFNPQTFDVSVEEIESDSAVVTQLNMGEDLPRVIWIIEDAES